MRPLKVQWQKVKDEYFGPEFVSISQQQLSKFTMQINKNILVSLAIKLMFFCNHATEQLMNIIQNRLKNIGQS